MSCECNGSPEFDELKARKLRLEADELETKIQRHKQEQAIAELKLEDSRLVFAEKAARGDRHRVLPFTGAVTGQSVHEAIGDLQWWHRQDPGCDISIVLNSPGGDVLHGLALYDDIIALRDSGHRVTITVRGMAASMGGILLQAGDERIIGKNAHLMIHEISAGAVGKLSEIEDEAKFCAMLSDRLLDILAERSTLTAGQIKRRWKRKDWWLSAQEAVELGFADRIG